MTISLKIISGLVFIAIIFFKVDEIMGLMFKSPKLKTVNIQVTFYLSNSRENFEERLNNLVFGYETNNVDNNDKNIKMMPLYLATNTSFAPCFQESSRPRGCLPLLEEERYTSPFMDLPCITDGICPYYKFRCSKGHQWKAVPGSPVCFHCPICKAPRQAKGLLSKLYKKERLETRIHNFIQSRSGQLIAYDLNNKDKWKSNIIIQCSQDHQWTTNPTNLLANNHWCKDCKNSQQKFTIEDMHQTAAHFDGKFLGLVNSVTALSNNVSLSLQTALWVCSRGHKFHSTANNIRRKEGLRRKCSWCPTCRKEGIEFRWIT